LLVSSSGVAVATVLNIIAPKAAFLTMVAISAFGALFTWMMIFVTHWYFRRRRAKDSGDAAFRMWGYPVTPLLGAGLMAALMVTTVFTEAFRLMLIVGLPFLVVLIIGYRLTRE